MCLHERSEDGDHHREHAGLGHDHVTQGKRDDAQAGNEDIRAAHDGREDGAEQAGQPCADAGGVHELGDAEDAADEDDKRPLAFGVGLRRRQQAGGEERHVSRDGHEAGVHAVQLLGDPEDDGDGNDDDALLLLLGDGAERLVLLLEEGHVAGELFFRFADDRAVQIGQNDEHEIPDDRALEPGAPGEGEALHEADHQRNERRAGHEGNAEDVRAHEVGKPQAAGRFAVRLRADSLTDLADQGRHDGGLGIGAGDHRGGDDAREHHGRDLATIGAGELREDPQRQALHEAAVVDADRHDEHADAQPDGRAGELDRDVRHLAEFEYQQHDHGRKGRDPVRQGAGDQARQQEAEAPEILPALTAHHFRFRRQVGDQQHQDNTAQNAENRLFHLLAHEFHSSLMNGSQLALSLVNYLSSWF